MKAILLLILGCTLTGCSSGFVKPPTDQPLSGDRAIERVKKTAEYRKLEQTSKAPLILMTDATGDDVRVEVQEDQGDARYPVASFRAVPDGRVYIWDDARGDWRVVATFD